MAYIVFARKYRPQTFDDVIGQSHITTTLKNAIAQSRVAHAYLFAGPRGVGKTTTARILAKALNCEAGPRPEPCNACASCKEITNGSSLDILEIDGASNNGVEQIRSLRENVKFAPSKGRFKVYIIDEVHMLSAEAFNALLKTLEEPPAHVKFVFATTHAHKVPPTILSRCQRFDFRRISTRDILASLKTIVKDEKLKVKDEALALIAKYGDGSMRDAQVILDQIASFSEGKVEVADVTKILGIVDDEMLFGLSAAIRKKDSAGALAMIDRLVNDGKDVVQVIQGLIEHFRNISVAKVSGDAESLIDAGAETVALYRDEACHYSVEEILYIIYTLSNSIDFVRRSGLYRIPFESAIVKLTQSVTMPPLSEILNRLQALEKGCQPSPSGPAQAPARAPVQAPRDYQPPRQYPDPVPEKPRGAGKTDAPAAPATEPKSDAPAAAPEGLDSIVGSWPRVVEHVKGKKISVGSYLEEGYPLRLESSTLTIGFPKVHQFHKEVLESLDNRRLIEEAFKTVMGVQLRVTLTIVDGQSVPGQADPLAGIRGDAMDADMAATNDDDPIIKSALEIFGGKLAGDAAKKGEKA